MGVGVDTDKAIQVLRKIATQLFDERSLSTELADDDLAALVGGDFADVSIDGRTLKFSNHRARNAYAAEALFTEMYTEGEDLRLEHFVKARRLAGYAKDTDNEDAVRGQYLARFDSEDLLAAAARIIRQERPSGIDTFSVLQGVEDALPYLGSISVASIIELTEAQDEQTRNDHARGLFFNALQAPFLKQQGLSIGVLDALQGRMSDSVAPLYHSAAIAYVKSDHTRGVHRLLRDISLGVPALTAAAVWALGNRLVHENFDSELESSVVAEILKVMDSSEVSARTVAFSAAASAAPKIPALSHELLRRAEAGDPEAIQGYATLLFHHNYNDLKHHADWPRWLNILTQLPASARGALDMFDMWLMRMAEEGNLTEATTSIEKWIRLNSKRIVKKHEQVVKIFDSTFRKVFENPDDLSALITRWFLLREMAFAVSVRSILQQLGVSGVRDLRFDESQLKGLSQEESLIFVRNVLGYVMNEEQLHSLFQSVARSENKHIRSYMREVFVDEIAEDYPSDTLEFLKKWRASEADQSLVLFCDEAIAVIQRRMDVLDRLPTLVELMPSSDTEYEFRKRRQKMMSKIQEEAHQKSIVAKLATQIPVKGGKGSISMRGGEYSPPSFFGSFTSSVKLPRRHVLDDMGYDMQASRLRLFGSKDDE
jgi:hypothetical protein